MLLGFLVGLSEVAVDLIGRFVLQLMPFDVVEQYDHSRASERPNVKVRMDQQRTQVLKYVVQIVDLILMVVTYEKEKSDEHEPVRHDLTAD